MVFANRTFDEGNFCEFNLEHIQNLLEAALSNPQADFELLATLDGANRKKILGLLHVVCECGGADEALEASWFVVCSCSRATFLELPATAWQKLKGWTAQ
eukprot:7423184-Karenia_brevis.AAC.1